MSYLYEVEPKFYPELLAAGKMDIEQQDPVPAGVISADPCNRTILIGLGGMGVETIDRIKRAVSSKLAPGWENCIAFLAIDADAVDLREARSLTDAEKLCITEPGVQESVNRGLAAYPMAWRSFVDADQARTMPGFNGNSAARRRLMGKMKLHYKRIGSKGVDEKIVARLEEQKNNVLAPIAPWGYGHYQVYVIGSICGGTCSGSFLQMPALIRRALNDDDRTKIHAMLYLPDTVTALHPEQEDILKANGYAALKELDYYQGLYMREDTEEIFPYNDPAIPELRLSSRQGFFMMPYLIGTRAGSTAKSKWEAIEAVAGFFEGILARMDPFGHNPPMLDAFLDAAAAQMPVRLGDEASENREKFGVDHSRPQCYGTLGFARASVPAQIVRAHAIAKACEMAGLEPISSAERDVRIAAGKPVPFLGEDQFLAADEFRTHVRALLEPLNRYLTSFYAPRFDYAAIFGANPTWQEIWEESADDLARSMVVDSHFQKMTGAEACRKLCEEVQAQFAAFRENVKNYVLRYGPMAFVNLYWGRAEGSAAIGICDALGAMSDGRNVDSGTPVLWPTPSDCEWELKKAREQIMRQRWGDIIPKVFFASKKTEVDIWVHSYNAWMNARINEALRGHMLGANGILRKYFIEPASILCRQLDTFGKVLTTMSRCYADHGSALNSFGDFAGVSVGSSQVNIAALDQGVYAHLKQKAERIAMDVDAMQLRRDLMDSFIHDPDEWTQFDAIHEVYRSGNRIRLNHPRRPIRARYAFDRCLRQHIPGVSIQMEELFSNAAMNSDDLAGWIVRSLKMQSGPLLCGALSGRNTRQFVVYPTNLQGAFQSAIDRAAQRELVPWVHTYSSADTDSVMMYQLDAPFELYRLAELKDWEKRYDEQIRYTGNCLHGMSPDLVRETDGQGRFLACSERTAWYDYPAITYSSDHKAPDPVTGRVSHEGEVRMDMDRVIEAAREKGILYSQQTASGWVIRRIRLDRARSWSFDEGLLTPNEDTGLLPEKDDLLRQILAQNGSTPADISKVVRLDYAGLLSRPHTTEQWAWDYASRVLYAHRPMFNEIRDTLEQTEPWFKRVDAINRSIMRNRFPAVMYRLIQGGMLKWYENGNWEFRDADGDEMVVVNFSPARLERLRHYKHVDAAILDTGLKLYNLFCKLVKCVTEDEMIEALERARENLNDEDYIFSEAFLAADKGVKDALDTELEIIWSLGGNLEDPSDPGGEFVRNLAERGIVREGQPAEILEFYRMIRCWRAV